MYSRLADADGVVRGLLSEELCAAAGMAERTYRRGRQELLESGELELVSGAGGRGNTNVWQVRVPAASAGGATAPPVRRVTPPAGVRPLLATVATPPAKNRPVVTVVPADKQRPDRTVSEQNCPAWSGVSPGKRGQDRTLFDETPAETPARNTRMGREPQKPRTGEDPPTPMQRSPAPANRLSRDGASTGGLASSEQMDGFEMHEPRIDGAATVFFFARTYRDDRSSAAAYERARARISVKDNTSLFRFRTAGDGHHLLFVLCDTLANARRARERIAWRGLQYSTTPDEINAIASRFREVAEAGGLNSVASWGGVGGLGLGPKRSRGPIRRPQG